MSKIPFSFFFKTHIILLLIIVLSLSSGCVYSKTSTGDLIINQSINNNTYILNGSEFQPFVFNTSGFPAIHNSTTLICSENVTCIQDTTNKTIRIDTSDEVLKDDDTITHNNTYEYADSIVATGFTSSSGNNTSLLNEVDNIAWAGYEAGGTPWSIIIKYHNITHFDSVESTHKYNSSGAPSVHIVSRYIWGVTLNEFVELEEFSNEVFWYYHVKRIPADDHYIFPNGTVIIKYEHPANGLSSHTFFIDTARLVVLENEILG